MIPGTNILDRLAALLAGDTTTLAPAAGPVRVHLAIAAFTPGGTLIPGSFTEATFTGYASLLAPVGAQQNFFDPSLGVRVVQLIEPLGGWHWVATNATGLPQTVFGFWVSDNANTVVYGSELLPAPIVLTAANQAIDLPQVRFRFVGSPLN